MVSRLLPVRLKRDTTDAERNTAHVVSAFRRTSAIALAAILCTFDAQAQQFRVEEATIAGIHAAMTAKRLTSVELVRLYLDRIKAYNGTCVQQPEGLLKAITPIRDAGQINALQTLNLRPATRQSLGFDDRKARSMTDAADDGPAMPDALQVAADLDRRFAQTGRLTGPLHGIVFAIKDQFDTVDMRTTNGADAFFANDRPPDDARLIRQLREAGAIILAKSNMGEYAAGDRSSFGGVMCNPYATDRSPGGSSGGSGTAVAANLVTCAIGEETAPSIRMPSRFNSLVGLSPSQGLVSRDGMYGGGINDRAGPICRTVDDVARVLQVLAGYDPADELTAFGVGRIPAQPYVNFTGQKSLAGIRLGVVREYMDKTLFTEADAESIEIVERAVADLRKLGATIVDPGAGKALFQECIDPYALGIENSLVRTQLPEGADNPSIRDFGSAPAPGERKWLYNRYLRERGDTNIRTLTDLIEKANFFTDIRPGSRFTDKKGELERDNKAATADLRDRMYYRHAVQQIVLQCMAKVGVDVLVYPTGNIPPPLLGAPTEPNKNGRSHLAWTLLGQQGFPAMTVPAGFTTHVYDRVPDAGAEGGTRLVGPVPAVLPVGIDFLGRPFDEPVLFRVASAYEAATHHRVPPRAFGPLVAGSR
jgi:Asp-tRNA(Asn)/Glu-tRNA(Gln) amidotransferase A subunit family amidase